MIPRPSGVSLRPHDPGLATEAAVWTERLVRACPTVVSEIHHIGSMSGSRHPSKPIVDLLAEVASIAELDSARDAVMALGFVWRGENWLAGRRYCSLSNPETGVRLVHPQCYDHGDPNVRRHVASSLDVRAG